MCKLIDFVIVFYRSLPERCESDYTKQSNGENPSQYFPNYPLLFDRPKYAANNASGEEENFENVCSKLFPEHVKLSPGLFLVTCACSQKKNFKCF